MLISLIIISFLAALDYHAIVNCAKHLVGKSGIEKSQQKKFMVIATLVLYFSRSILFMYLLLIDLENPLTTIIVRYIIFPMYVYFCLIILIKEKNFQISKKSFVTFFSFSGIFFVFLIAGENSWDGSAYHLPIELMIRDNGSLWGWPEVIFSQWGLIGGDLANALFHIGFGNARAGILPTLIYSVLFLKLVMIFESKYRWVILVVIVSIPSFTNQIGTRYIDSQLAIGLAILYMIIKTPTLMLNRLKLFSLICTSAYIFSIKLSAITGVLLILFLLMIEKKIELREKIFAAALVLLGSVTGTFPVFLRNLIEHNNPFFPFYSPGFTNGYLSLTKFSDQLQNSYRVQLGGQDQPLVWGLFHQYIASPFVTLFDLTNNIFNHSGNLISQINGTESFYRTFVYDNRLSGFGPSFVLMLIVFILLFGRQGLLHIFGIILLIFITPTSIHARYSLGLYLIGLVFISLVVEKREMKIEPPKNLLRPFLAASLIFAVLNIGNVYFRMFPNGLGVYPEDRNTYTVSNFVNPDCAPIVHYGSGLWGGDALWGPNLCGKVVKSTYVNGYILDAALGPEVINSTQLEEVSLFAAKYPDNLRILCSTPSTAPIEEGITTIPVSKINPCDKIFERLSNEYFLTKSQELIEERVGPHLSVIKLSGRKG